MSTKHKRIGVIRDPELDRALAKTQSLFHDGSQKSAAAQVRALALLGAESMLEQSDEASKLRAILIEKYGARPATRNLRDFMPLEEDIYESNSLSKALQWTRGQ